MLHKPNFSGVSYDFFLNLEKDHPIVALDFGRKNVGIACSDVQRKFALPHSVFKRKKTLDDDVDAVHSIYLMYSACLLVVGIPYTHVRNDGWVEEIEYFGSLISKKYSVPVFFQDESFTSIDVSVIVASRSAKNKKKMIDKLSACYILEGALSTINCYSQKN